jgi:S1-C subfamily serine protease
VSTGRGKTSGFLLEVTKVSVIFIAFYLLQTQILEVREDVYGRASGIAFAEARTTTQADRRIERALEDSAVELARAKESLEVTRRRLEEERDQLRTLIERRSGELEAALRSQIDIGGKRLESLELLADANAQVLGRLQGSVVKDAALMKRKMISPTVQLRGNGTVGSGVLIYSEAQAESSSPAVATSFVLTASHVVQEVVGESLRERMIVGELLIHADDTSEDPESYTAELVIFDTAKDLALLRVNSSRRFPCLAELASRVELDLLDVFSPAYAVGCPLGNRPMPTLGEISSKSKVVSDQTFWMLNAPTFFGNSGGGIYQIPSYRLVGVSSMIYTYGKRSPTVVPHMGLFVPLSTIFDWLDAASLGFVYQRRAIPRERVEDLVYLEREAGRPIPAAAASHEATTGVESDPEH